VKVANRQDSGELRGVVPVEHLPPPHSAAVVSGALSASNINRRVGLSPRARGSLTNGTCPDIFELIDGNFAIIGTDRTAELRDRLPVDAAVATYEKIVVITRDAFLAAAKDLAGAR
jgi:hypothetical protein